MKPAITARIESAFWSRVPVGDVDVCWPFNGTTTPTGYAVFSQRVDGKTWTWLAHRLSYELLVGPIPSGLQLDHTCHDSAICRAGDACPHRRCVNPNHLEAVTHDENMRRTKPGRASWQKRKTHCPYGHPYDGDNLLLYKGHRVCRLCRDQRNAERRRRERTGAPHPGRLNRRRELLLFFASDASATTPTSAQTFARRGRPRQTHCKWGHPLDGPNLYLIPSNGQRRCLACKLGMPAMADLLAEASS